MKEVLFILLLFPFAANAQVTRQWVTTYNGPANMSDWPHSMAVDKQGNVYVTGQSYGTESSLDYATIKYNSEGIEQWVARYNYPDNSDDEATSLALDSQGNVYVTGRSSSDATSYDFATIKYNSEGVEQWVARYSYTTESRFDGGSSITVDKEGFIFVTGQSRTYLNKAWYYYYVTIKYDPDGIEKWVSIYDEAQYSEPVVIKTDDAGNVYVTGTSTLSSKDFLTIKYNSDGVKQWVNRFDGPANSFDQAAALAVDKSGNVYVSGVALVTSTKGAYATIKYNTAGSQEWVQYYDGTSGRSLAADSSGNVIVTGKSLEDFGTVKYNSAGVQQWDTRYNGTGNSEDGAISVLVDADGNSYVTGGTTGDYDQLDIATIKYNPDGVEAWAAIYNGPANQGDMPDASAIDENGNIYVTGQSYKGANYDYVTIKYTQNMEVSIIKPSIGSKFIAGQIDTIKWNGGQGGQTIQIEYSTDNGNTYITIDSLVLASSGNYLWDVPDNLLTTKAKIRITDMDHPAIGDESDAFRIKPYLLTRLNEDSTYYAFRKDRDQFGFSNTPEDTWPSTWYKQFNYQGTDPFTGKPYPQTLYNGVFARNSDWHPDWVSWVNAFSIKACYKNTNPVVYDQAALLRWTATLHLWGGSCFGITAANALYFSNNEQFYSKYSSFPEIYPPISFLSDDGVKSVVNELFTHQYGNIYGAVYELGLHCTPYQTLQELKQMLLEDDASTRALTILNNNGDGGHSVSPYELQQDSIHNYIYYLKVYDNSYPNSNNPITIDLSANGGNGSWSTPDWLGWGGKEQMFLDCLSEYYLNNATKKNSTDDYKSPFILPDDRLEIINNPNSDIIIRSFNTDWVTSYSNNILLNEIPNSFPLMIIDGSERPPYGYSLPTPGYDFYIIEMNNFLSDTLNTFFFTGNKSFLYQRNGATQTQTDQLHFDGGVHVNNSDDEIKTFSLLSLINETTQEKLCIFRSLKTAASQEVTIDIPDSNQIKITTYSTAQEYNIELNYLTGNGIGKFICNNIALPENSSHTIIPDWENLTDSMLIVVVDLNDDYIMDDTLYFNNQYTGFGDDENSPLLPRGFSMSQNWPNPFDKTTVLTYQLPVACKVTLKVLDLLGKEVATLVNENKPAGNYKVEFDASFLSPGIYFYKLESGSFAVTKKMILYR